MDRKHERDISRQQGRPIRPPFEDFAVSEVPRVWYDHPLVPRGGIAAATILAVVVFGKIALSALAEPSLSEAGKLALCFSMGLFALLASGFAVWNLRAVVIHAETQKARSSPPQSRSRSRSP